MSPGQVVQGLYNYSSNTGMKQWIKATKPLGDKPYEGSSKGLSHFLSKLLQRHLHQVWPVHGAGCTIKALVRFQFDLAGVRITT